MDEPEEPLPYASVSETAWNSEGASRWRGTIDPTVENSLSAEGTCPRCRHRADSAQVDQVVPLVTPGAELVTESVQALGLREYTFICNCSGEHSRSAEAPDEGCGAYWNMVALWNNAAQGPTPVSFFGGTTATAEDLRQAVELRELDDGELERVRAAADKWKTGLTALLALIATVSVVKGRDSFKDLDAARQNWIIFSLGIALILATGAGLLAMRAAYGPLKRQSLDKGGLRAVRRREAREALIDLRVARTLTVLCLVALAIAVGLTWKGVEAKSGNIRVTRKSDESAVCGVLVDAKAQRVRVKDTQETQSIPLTDVKTVEFVQKC